LITRLLLVNNKDYSSTNKDYLLVENERKWDNKKRFYESNVQGKHTTKRESATQFTKGFREATHTKGGLFGWNKQQLHKQQGRKNHGATRPQAVKSGKCNFGGCMMGMDSAPAP